MATPQQLLKELHAEVERVKLDGHQAVSVDALKKVLEDAIEQSENPEGEIDKEALSDFRRANYSMRIELLKGVFVFGVEALKAAMLINGGAAVAVLSFTSAQWKVAKSEGVLTLAASSMLCFVLGVLTAAIGTGLSYAAQHQYADEKQQSGKNFHVAAVITVVISYCLFLGGAFSAYYVFV